MTQTASGRDGLLSNEGRRLTVAAEVFELFKLAIPIFINMVSWVTMKVTDTAVLGHVGTRYLDASALSDLWTSSTGVFISSRVVGTFCGQAYGAGNKQLVGIWLQVAYVVLMSIMIPVAICWCLTDAALRAMGKSEIVSADAGYYAVVLALCLPVRIAFSQLSTFFSSQKILRPSVVCATSAMLLNLFGALVLVLGLGIPGWHGFGFHACPWVTATVEYFQLFILWYIFCHRKQLHKECWPGWSKEHITRDRVTKFVKMYLPAALAIGSDFWRVAAIGAVASDLGDVNLGVFNAGYRICWMMLTFMGALASAVSIQLTQALGRGAVADAKRSAVIGTSVALACVLLLGMAIVCIPRKLGSIFSEDPEVLDKFEEVRFPFAAFAVLMNLSVNLEKLPMACGRVTAVFRAGLVGSWLGQVPAVLLCVYCWRKDLVALYTGVAAGYGLLAVLYGIIIFNLDWEKVCQEARERSEAAPVPKPADGGQAQGTSLQPVQPEEEQEEA
eukprot:TRINITY_DN4918_c0_g2_i1.p1 TRINITY_DN4918_c0_g2~~TRINITY_DN4918_c0_g2_i1.p1  ORF type:complete len:501 (+),score=57.17 TRINITY_DN4918_c0_g2_i1:92-1594(+)